jgi:glycosyltransferase involved in cell wall biosynthesis
LKIENVHIMRPEAPKIAILADFPWSFLEGGATGRGGGQQSTWLSQIAEQYSYSGDYDIHWISLYHRNRWIGSKRRRTWGGQHFCEIELASATANLELNYLPARWLLGREIKKLKPDLIHCWGTESSYPIICGHASVPTLLSMQGIMTEYDRIGTFDGSRFWKKVCKWESGFLNNATLVTTESQWGMERVKEVAPSIDVRKVEYGVHPSFYELKWAPDLSAPFALYTGSIDHRKGLDLLVDAIAGLEKREWTLKIAGDGPLRAELEARNIPGIEWLGMLEWKSLQELMTKALCFVMPTRADTSPNAVKEARVVGLPVVTTKHGGQTGYIIDGENGYIVEPLTAMRFGEALNLLMTNPSLAIKMGNARHLEDRAYFRVENTANEFQKLYKELLDR